MRTCVIVGAGLIARTHMLACVAARHKVRLVGILDGGSGRAGALASEAAQLLGHDVVHIRSLPAISADRALDFVIVATPPDVRESVIFPFIQAHKHVLLEKPIARDLTAAINLVSVCRQANITLGVVFQHRTRMASIKAKELVESGALGALGLCEIVVPWWRPQSYYDEFGRGSYTRDGGGVLITQAIHMLDLALSLAGRVRSVQALAATTPLHHMEAEDFVSAGLRFESGAVGSIVASTASFPGRPEAISLHFENASLNLASGVLSVNWRDGRTVSFGEVQATAPAPKHQLHQQVIEDFVDALQAGRDPIASGASSLPCHWVINAIEKSARTGRVISVGHA